MKAWFADIAMRLVIPMFPVGRWVLIRETVVQRARTEERNIRAGTVRSGEAAATGPLVCNWFPPTASWPGCARALSSWPVPVIPDYCLAVVLGPVPEGAFASEEVVDGPAAAEARLSSRGLAAVTSELRLSEYGGWTLLARRHHAPPVALVPPLPDLTPRRARHAARERAQLLARLPREGFAAVHDLAPGARIDRAPLPCDRRDLEGPFDVIGDVHGHSDALDALLDELGWSRGPRPLDRHPSPGRRPPPGRRAVFTGDLVDRGPTRPACWPASWRWPHAATRW